LNGSIALKIRGEKVSLFLKKKEQKGSPFPEVKRE